MARGRRRPSAMEQRAKQSSGQLAKDWAALTWNKDRAKVGPLPIFAWNMLVVVVLGLLLYLGAPSRLWVGAALALFLVWTIARAGAVMPRRRKALTSLYEALRAPAALPRGTSGQPISPETYINVVQWGKHCRPAKMVLTIKSEAKAAQAQPFRQLLEKSVQKGVETPDPADEWIFEWADASHVTCTAVNNEDPRVFIRNQDRRMLNVLCDKALFDGAANAETHDYVLTVEDRKESERNGTVYHFPTKVVFNYGGFDASDPMFREKVTDAFDRSVGAPGVWIYNWEETEQLLIELVDDNDVRALRKKEKSKIVADCYALVGNKRGVRLDVEVTKWMAEGKTKPPHFPIRVRVDFGKLNLGDRRDRNDFEQRFDTAMQARYEGLVWLYDWQPGATTVLDVKAVPEGSQKARRKETERTLRNVIENKFKSGKGFVDCDVLEWQEKASDTGAALVQKAEVKFGSVDVNARDVRDGFQEHWDSLTTDNDWHYSWDAPQGKVTVTAVPRIPDGLAFPEYGTAEFDEAIELAKKGILRFGPQKGGGWLEWDLNETSHGLVGGKTGSGKSVALSIVLFYALYLPEYFDVIVCDPKRTDFTWTPEFPSVIKFAATDVELCEACAYARAAMNERQTLLNRTQARKLSKLREKYAVDSELERKFGPVPKRLILFFDEIADFLAAGSDEDLEELKKVARGDLESIGRLGRATETNIVSAAQKPDAKIISTQFRSQLAFRMGVGPLDQWESQQILNSDHGTRFPEAGTPKGRAWGYDPKNGYRQVQVMYLPDDSEQSPWDPTATITGVKDRIRKRLTECGYQRIEHTNKDGGIESRWVIVEDGDDSPASPAIGDSDRTDDDTQPSTPALGGASGSVTETRTEDDDDIVDDALSLTLEETSKGIDVEPEGDEQAHEPDGEADRGAVAPPASQVMPRRPRRSTRASGPAGGMASDAPLDNAVPPLGEEMEIVPDDPF